MVTTTRGALSDIAVFRAYVRRAAPRANRRQVSIHSMRCRMRCVVIRCGVVMHRSFAAWHRAAQQGDASGVNGP